MRKLITILAATCALALTITLLPGCGDDVKKTQKIERYEESQPQMVSPGEMIVE